MNMQKTIESTISAAFELAHLQVENESHLHNVAPGSESHFKLTIVSEAFDSLPLIKRHRMVNKALEQELRQIHALALHTLTPREWEARVGKVITSPRCRGGGKNQ